ncbi:MAG: UDP-4-amino-4,6-dideoxy-N-acetyl-beta-L-altrosamine transaminase [Firmicutes bacterium]|nr:UDP-4-amino-4,6-dideoxy-N-acetyl-beta-L-altrosamine transaminase [Bacillota bacterium]
MKIPYGKQYITEEDKAKVLEVLGSELITQGEVVPQFENAVAAYHGAKYAVAFSNGTAALHAAYAVLGVGPGDEAISSPITFAASMNGALYSGATPKFVDMDPATNCMDISKLEEAITPKTKVITPVSFGGFPVDLKAVREIADKHGCAIIHDAAHAIGSRRDGKFGMDYADMAILSFHPVKHVTTGEGGMVLTNSKELNDKLRLFKSHGITRDPELLENNDGPWYYEMQSLGFNYRITEFQAALGLSQFSRMDENLKARNAIAKRYAEELGSCGPVSMPPDLGYEILENDDPDTVHSYHLYTVTAENVEERRKIYDYMRSKNIFVQIHYVPVHLHPYYRKNFGFKEGDFPEAEKFYSREISIPMYHSMTEEEQMYVIDALKKY